MRIEHLEYMIEVVRSGSINSAAEKLHINQQNLNKIMKNLEEELGTKLLSRTRRGVKLTEDGENSLLVFQEIVYKMNNLKESLQGNTSKVDIYSGPVRVTVSPVLSLTVLPFVVSEFIHLYPKIKIYVNDAYRDTIIDRVVSRENDFGLIAVSTLIEGFAEGIPDEVEVIELKRYPAYVAMSSRHPLAQHKQLSLNSISSYPVVVYEAGGAKGIHAFHDKVVLSTDNYRLCEECLQSNDTIMYSYPLYLKRNVFSNCVHIPISDVKATSSIYMIIHKEASAKQRKIAQLFLENVQGYL